MNLFSKNVDSTNFSDSFEYSEYALFPRIHFSRPGLFAINENKTFQNIPMELAFGSQLDSSLLTEISLSALIFGVAAPLNAITLFMQVRTMFSTDTSSQQRMMMKLGLQMTIANLIILLVCCMGRAFWLYTYFWYGGDILCRLFSFSYALGHYLWSNLACAIAIDIFICIRMPIKARANTELRAKVIIGSVWPISIVFSLPHFVFRGAMVVVTHPEYGPLEQCSFLDEFNDIAAAYELYNQVISFYIPFVVMTVCYIAAICSYLSSVRTQGTLQEGRNMNASIESNNCRTKLLKSDSSQFDHQLSEKKNVSANGGGKQHRFEGIPPLGIPRSFSSAKDRLLSSAPFKSSASPSMTSSSHTENIQRQQSQKCGRALGHRLVITAIVVVVTYVLTWCPGQIFALWRLACRVIPGIHCDPINTWEWMEVLLYTCTISNPFVYKFLHAKRKSNSSEAILRQRATSSKLSKALGASDIETKLSAQKEIAIDVD